MTLNSIEMIEAGRLERTKGRGVVTSDDQRAKALDLAALGQGRRMLAEVKEAHKTRMAEVNAAIDTGSADRYKVLGAYYLVQAQFAPRSADRIALLGMAEDNANKSGNAALIDEVRKAKEGTQ